MPGVTEHAANRIYEALRLGHTVYGDFRLSDPRITSEVIFTGPIEDVDGTWFIGRKYRYRIAH